MAVTSRQTAREALATQLASDLTAEQIVKNFVPNDLVELGSPVVTVSSWSWEPEFQASAHDNSIELIVTVWVMRQNKEQGLDYAEDAEDELDTVSKQIVDSIEGWNDGEFSRASETDYAVIDGWQYRTESHFVRVEHYEGE
jgi:hypothetical protein